MEKSHQNRRSCRPSVHSARAEELIAHQCPPDMTVAIKAAFKKEIAAFDEFDALAAKQAAEASAKGNKGSEEYSDWVEKHGGNELVEANPDLLSEEDRLKYLPISKDEAIARILKEFRETLSDRELQVWNLIMARQMTRKETASLLSISERTVSSCLRRGYTKFNKFAEAIKRARED